MSSMFILQRARKMYARFGRTETGDYAFSKWESDKRKASMFYSLKLAKMLAAETQTKLVALVPYEVQP